MRRLQTVLSPRREAASFNTGVEPAAPRLASTRVRRNEARRWARPTLYRSAKL